MRVGRADSSPNSYSPCQLRFCGSTALRTVPPLRWLVGPATEPTFPRHSLAKSVRVFRVFRGERPGCGTCFGDSGRNSPLDAAKNTAHRQAAFGPARAGNRIRERSAGKTPPSFRLRSWYRGFSHWANPTTGLLGPRQLVASPLPRK
jgi:hypothetical protein